MKQGPEYEILFYETADGYCPVDDYLDELSIKVRAKIEKWMEQLEIYGPDLPRPYADSLRDKIRELRIKFSGSQYRLLYFFSNKKIVMTHGILKKTEQVPEEEIDKAVRMMKDYETRLKRGEIEL